MKASLALVFVSFLALAQAGPLDLEIQSYSIVDNIIKGVLEGIRPKVASLTFDDVNEKVSSAPVNASIIIRDILVQNLDKFVICNLKSSIIPLKLVNITLTWDEIIASASYDVSANVSFPPLSGRIYGKGKAKASLGGLFLTVGANLEMKENKYIQIKPKGLFGFDVSVARANVFLESVMGSQELGQTAGTFISQIIPGLVRDLKKPVYEAFEEDLIKFLNQYLKGSSGKEMLDEIAESAESEESFDLDKLEELFDNDFEKLNLHNFGL